MKASVRFGLLGVFIALAAAMGVATSGGLAKKAYAVPPVAGTTLAVGAGCTAAVAINASTSCVVTVANPTAAAVAFPAGAFVLSFTGANGGGVGTTGWGQVQMASVGAGGSGAASAGGVVDIAGVTVVNAIGGVQTLTVTCDGGICDFAAGASLVITASLKGAVGGPVNGTITYPGGTTDPAGTVTVGPATTFIQPNVAPPGSMAACTPNSVVNVGSGAAGAITCQIDLDDNDLVDSDAVSGGNVTVTATGPAGLNISAAGYINITPTSISGRCGTSNTPQSCGFVSVVIASATGSVVTGPVSLAIQYNPDLGAVNTALTQNIANVANIIQPVAAFISPTALTITCGTPTSVIAVPGPLAPTIGAPIAIATLGTSIQCRAVPTPAAVAAGTIEVSSLNGTLIDATGRLTTNLRITCGDPTVIVLNLGPAIDPNTCTGVVFNVTGFGVGTVDLRARYEPSNQAAQAGVAERETSASVFFAAPNPCGGTGCSLVITPAPPITVGQTATITLRFGSTPISCGVGIFCVDPTTGLPLTFRAGSILNGTVVFTIADSTIISWVLAQPSVSLPAPSSTAGFIATANQTAVRCGLFPTSSLSGAGTIGFVPEHPGLSQFFGGCESASATFRGIAPGITGINASFIPDLPGAVGILSALPAGPATPLFPTSVTGFTGLSTAVEVIGVAPSGNVQLARGCNNVSPTVTEAATAYAARVSPSAALTAIWEHQAATNTFRGWSPAAGAPNDLPGVTRLRPVFICVSAAAELSQPPA